MEVALGILQITNVSLWETAPKISGTISSRAERGWAVKCNACALFMQCVMRSRTGTSAPSALPVRFQAGKIFLSTNRKSHFLSLIISKECVMIK